MIVRSKIKNTLSALSGAVLLGTFAQTTPAEARHWQAWDGYDRHVVVHHHIVSRSVARRVVHVYRPLPDVRRVVVVERSYYYPRARHRYGWHHRVAYRPGWTRYGWHDRPRCWLPERYLCR